MNGYMVLLNGEHWHEDSIVDEKGVPLVYTTVELAAQAASAKLEEDDYFESASVINLQTRKEAAHLKRMAAR